MKKIGFILAVLCGTLLRMSGQEYVYPVGVLSHQQEKIYLLYQKSLGHVELWIWDVHTKEAQKGLLSTFTPAGL